MIESGEEAQKKRGVREEPTNVAQPDLTGDRAVALKAIKDETIELDKSFRDKHKTQKAAH